MSYFIFTPNLDNVDGTLYRIAENQNDFNNLIIIPSQYKIIEDSQSNFNSVKNKSKSAKYNNDVIIYTDTTNIFRKKTELEQYKYSLVDTIKLFINSNPNHPSVNLWNNYINQLNNFDTGSITYPFNKSLEQHFDDLGLISLNTLQLP